MLSEVLICPACRSPLRIEPAGRRMCCGNAAGSVSRDGIVIYDPEIARAPPEEMVVRDRQASSYLAHGKFPTQLYRIGKFVGSLPADSRGAPVLDLGCGPGPTTRMLLAAGFSVVAVDFSQVSLEINAQACRSWRDHALFVQADLNTAAFSADSVGGLMMADFLQHLGDTGAQRSFLSKAFSALRPGGWFFLSFFNTNLVNRLKGDLTGSFSRGIHYRRLTIGEVRTMLPPDVLLTGVRPMNIFSGALADRIATSLPLSSLLSRMILFTGCKAGGVPARAVSGEA